MSNPIRKLLDQCSIGFTLKQKWLLTLFAFLYFVNPLDFDFIILIGWIDDWFVIYLACRVWGSPTLPRRQLTPPFAAPPTSMSRDITVIDAEIVERSS
jgi:hypothetical protein